MIGLLRPILELNNSVFRLGALTISLAPFARIDGILKQGLLATGLEIYFLTWMVQGSTVALWSKGMERFTCLR